MWYVNQYLSINIGPPAFFQMDNGSEFTMLDAYATALPSNVVRSIPNIKSREIYLKAMHLWNGQLVKSNAF